MVVRPDGKISLPLLNDIDAAGQSPEELRAAIAKAAAKFVEEPNVTVVVKEINSRNVFITGQVTKAGSYPLSSGMTVLQLIALRRWPARVRRRQEHRHHAQGERTRPLLQVQLQGRYQGEERRAEHRA